MSHDDNVRKLAAKFANQRYPSFGPILQSLNVQGFRGVADLQLDFQSPVTALSGLNGTGKSTLAQLASCGYKKPTTAALPRYYVKDYFPVSVADPQPFTDDARVIYSYCVERGADPQTVTVTRAIREWSGYKRQPERACYYIGFTQFIPKVERRDFSIYRGRSLELGTSTPLSERASQAAGRVLGLPYELLEFTEVSHRHSIMQLAMATRNGRRYSENHMGFGEGRVIYMVNTMEAAPAQSLFVLEEPETSLHGDAQRRLAQYFIEVSQRRGHQLIITTHSAAILGELNRNSKIYLRRNSDGSLLAAAGLSTYQIDSFLQSRRPNDGAVTICVEDAFAQALLTEILRRWEPERLAGCRMLRVGGGQELPRAVDLLRRAGVRTIGVADGDMTLNSDMVGSLPGQRPPELEVFESDAVTQYFAAAPYFANLPELLASSDGHHAYASVLAANLSAEKETVAIEACRAYVGSLDEREVRALLDFVSSELTDRS